MGSYAATQHTTWAGGFDFTTELNSLVMDIAYDELDDTRYGHTGRARKVGLESVETQLGGLWSAGSGTPDTEIASTLATSVQPVTHTPTGTELDVAWFYQARYFRYSQGGPIGELYPFELNAKSAKGSGLTSVGAVRGRLLKAKGTVSATGALGSGYQLGAVGASQYLYGALHVFSAGTTITAVLESDDNAGFSSATTRATLGPITTAGGTWATRVAGAITDDYYRFRVTAITGTFTVGACAGIK